MTEHVMRCRIMTVDDGSGSEVRRSMAVHVAPLVYTVPEAAELARVSRRTLERAVQSGELASVKRGGRRVILPEALRAWARGERGRLEPVAEVVAEPEKVVSTPIVMPELKVIPGPDPDLRKVAGSPHERPAGTVPQCEKCGKFLLFGKSHRCEP